MVRRPMPRPLPPLDEEADEARRRFKAENQARIAQLRRESAEMRREIDKRVQRRVEIIAIAKAKLLAHRIGVIRRAREKLAELDAKYGKDNGDE
jgi:hypothetical protein